jgi:hypothetical protein
LGAQRCLERAKSRISAIRRPSETRRVFERRFIRRPVNSSCLLSANPTSTGKHRNLIGGSHRSRVADSRRKPAVSAERNVILSDFNVFEWVPRNPGLYHTDSASDARVAARDHIRSWPRWRRSQRSLCFKKSEHYGRGGHDTRGRCGPLNGAVLGARGPAQSDVFHYRDTSVVHPCFARGL